MYVARELSWDALVLARAQMMVQNAVSCLSAVHREVPHLCRVLPAGTGTVHVGPYDLCTAAGRQAGRIGIAQAR